MAYLESHQELRDHPKTRKAARMLGISIPQFLGHLHLLWWWSLDYADDGDLSGYENYEVADAAMWEGDAAVFLNALCNCGKPGAPGFADMIECDGAITITLHDWDEYAGKLIAKRKADAKRKRDARLGLTPQDVQNEPSLLNGTSGGRPPDGAGTVPYRTNIKNIQKESFDAMWDEFKQHYPDRQGKRVGIDSVAKDEARKLSPGEWPALLAAVKAYAGEQLPVDPIRFFKSKEYPNGLWREIKPAVTRMGPRGDWPPEGYSLARNPDGSFKRLGRDPVTQLLPWGGNDVVEDDLREQEERAKAKAGRRTA